ncbi:MAG: hypothetical protein AAGJ56_00070 [Myxococcota bacterium]
MNRYWTISTFTMVATLAVACGEGEVLQPGMVGDPEEAGASEDVSGIDDSGTEDSNDEFDADELQEGPSYAPEDEDGTKPESDQSSSELEELTAISSSEPGTNAWVPMFVQSEDFYNDPITRGKGGYQLQFMHCGDRSPVHPDRVMFGQDVSSFWRLKGRNSDGTLNWEHAPARGLRQRYSASVKFHPTEPDTVIVLMSNQSPGKANAGIYKSTDYGDSFKKVKALQNVTGGSRNSYGGLYRNWRELIAYAPSQPNRWYVLNPTYQMLRSNDDGETWTVVGEHPKTKNMKRVFSIRVHPTDANRLYAASETGLWKSSDGGKNWSKAPTEGLPPKAVTSLHVSPENGDEVLVVSYLSGLYRSTNGGASFSQLKAHKSSLAFVSPADDNVIYLMNANRDLSDKTLNAQPIVSMNGGSSWETMNVPVSNDEFVGRDAMGWRLPQWQGHIRSSGGPNINMQGGILPDPFEPTEAIANTQCVMYSTEDSGNTWTNDSRGYDSLGFGDSNIGNVYWDLNDHRRFGIGYFDYGMFLTTTGGRWFTRRNSGSFGLSHTAGQYSGGISKTDPQRILSCFGYYSGEASTTVSQNDGREWQWTLKSKDNYHHCTFADWHDDVNGLAYTDKWRSTDGGKTWSAYWQLSGASGFPGNATNDGKVIGKSFSDNDIVWAMNHAGDVIHRSTDRGKTWKKWHKLSRSIKGNRKANTFYPHPTNSKGFYYFAGASRGAVYVDGQTRNGSGDFVEQALGPDGFDGVDRIRVDPRYPEIIYVFAGNSGQAMVYRSIDSGSSWENISFNLPRTAANRSLEVHPLTGDVVVGGTAGTRWLKAPYEDPNTLVDEFVDMFVE